MSASAINTFTIVAAPSAVSAKTSAAQTDFVDTLQVAVRESDPPTARSNDKNSTVEREENREDSAATVNAEQHASDEDTTRSSQAASEPQSETEANESDSTEQPETDDTLVVSDAAQQIVAEEGTLKQVEVEVVQGEDVEIVSESENSGQQHAEGELPEPTSTTNSGGQSSTGKDEPLLVDGEQVSAEAQSTVEVSAGETSSAEDIAVTEASEAPSRPATGEEVNSDAADGQGQAAEERAASAQSTSDTASKAATTADKQSVPTDAQEKPRSSGEGRAKRGEEKVAETADSSPQQPVEAETELTTELESEVDADASQPEVREKPSQNPSSFNSILERATGPASRRGGEAEPAQEVGSRVDPQRFVSRVTKAFQAAEQRGGAVQLRLSPPELGALRIELNIQNGTLQAKLETETSAAKNVLMDNLPALRDRLAAQEIRVDKFEVDVRQQNQGGQPDWQAQQEQQDARHYREARQVRQSVTHRGTSGEQTAPEARGPQTNHDGQFSAVA